MGKHISNRQSRVSQRVRYLLRQQNRTCTCGEALHPNNLVEFNDILICNLCNMRRLGLI